MNIKHIPYDTIPKLFLLPVLMVLVSMLSVQANASCPECPSEKISNEDDSGDRISAYKQNKYRKDATRLALRMISADNDFVNLKPEAPRDLVESIYNALIAVHKSKLAKARIVTEIHKLHTFPIPTVDHFFVVYKRNAKWATPLRLGDTTTNSTEINELLDRYGLVIDRHLEWDEEHNSFNVRSARSLNIAPIAKAFSTIEDIVLVDMLLPNGDGNDIEIKKVGNGWEISYIIKFDSCITGCKKKHSWTFFVDQHNKVSFQRESGDELPVWMQE